MDDEEEEQPPLSIKDAWILEQEYLHQQVASARADGVSAAAPQSAVSSMAHTRCNYMFRQCNSNGPLPRVQSVTGMKPYDRTILWSIQSCLARLSRPPNMPDTMLRMLHKDLVLNRRAYEESMMRTPRYGEPACSAGNRCVGTELICGGETLVAFFPESTWNEYASTPNGRLPANERQCILCYRDNIQRALAIQRQRNLALKPSMLAIGEFYNLADVPGEYRSEDCVGPRSDRYEGILYFVVKLCTSSFRREVASDCTYFRQTLGYPGERPQPLPSRRF